MSVVQQLTELYEAKYDDLVRIYKGRAGENDVEDVVQEGFYRALHYVNSFNPTFISLENWLTSIMNNCLKDMLRERRDGTAMHTSEEDPTIDSRCPADEQLEEVIISEIAKKRGDTKQILWLYFVMGYKLEDIHKALSCSYHNVHRATVDFRLFCNNKYGYLMRD